MNDSNFSVSIKAVCRSEGQQKPSPYVGEGGGGGAERGWAGAGGGGWVRNHKPATSAGNRMHFICIRSCMIHQHHFTRVQNITFSWQMLIYDKQLIWETSELGSIKDPLTFTSFCLRSACAAAFACPTCAAVFGQCWVSQLQAVIFLSRWDSHNYQNYYWVTTPPTPIIKWVYSQSCQTKYKSAHMWQHLHI